MKLSKLLGKNRDGEVLVDFDDLVLFHEDKVNVIILLDNIHSEDVVWLRNQGFLLFCQLALLLDLRINGDGLQGDDFLILLVEVHRESVENDLFLLILSHEDELMLMRVGHQANDQIVALEASLLSVGHGGKGVLVVLVGLD